MERNTGCGARHSSDKKRAARTGEEREVDDRLVEKRARLNKEQQLKRPINESGLNTEGAVLIGEKNSMIVQLPLQLGLQNRNGSTLELEGPFKNFVTEYLQLIEQKQQQEEAQIKDLKEALSRAKAETKEEKEARIAVEQKLSVLTEERNTFFIEQAKIKEALDRAKAETKEEKEARTAAEQKLSVLTEERNAFFIEQAKIKEALNRANAETKEEKEGRVEAEQKLSILTEKETRVAAELDRAKAEAQIKKLEAALDREKLKEVLDSLKAEAQIKKLKEALARATAETKEEKEAKIAAEQKLSILNEEELEESEDCASIAAESEEDQQWETIATIAKIDKEEARIKKLMEALACHATAEEARIADLAIIADLEIIAEETEEDQWEFESISTEDDIDLRAGEIVEQLGWGTVAMEDKMKKFRAHIQ